MNFWIENDTPPFGTFPKIHPFWMCQASLGLDANSSTLANPSICTHLQYLIIFLIVNFQPGRQLPARQPIHLPPSHRWAAQIDFHLSIFDNIQHPLTNTQPPFSASHHHHHHYSLGATDQASQPEKEPVANAPLGKPRDFMLYLRYAVTPPQTSPPHHRRVVSRSAAVEPTETSLRSNRLHHSDQTRHRPLSIRWALPPVLLKKGSPFP